MLACHESVRFEDFGPSRFLLDAPPALGELTVGADLKQARRELRGCCPKEPGVYGMLDANGALIYVGKSKALLSRLTTYLQTPEEQTKSQRILQHAVRIVWEVWPHELLALARELELIVRWRPQYNVQGQPGRKRLGWLCVGGSEAAGAYLAAQPPRKNAVAFGPLPGGSSMREAIRLLNDCFQLRDCPSDVPMHFADERSLFPLEYTPQCLRAELGTCLSPCAAGCTRKEYGRAVRKVKAFLRGDDRSLVTQFTSEMQQAAAKFDFERAALLRDKLSQLEWLAALVDLQHVARRDYTFAYPIESPTGSRFWCLVDKGQLGVIVPEPPDVGQLAAVWQTVADHPANRQASDNGHLLDLTLLVAHWFHRNPEELARTIRLPEQRAG